VPGLTVLGVEPLVGVVRRLRLGRFFGQFQICRR
jgi:hypothetical protein